jgi:glyoxylase-like metal-dependent hydrolase (beta-lactamase superfamily II)
MDATKTLHWSNSDVEVHKVVVGPVDNNVFVVRCRSSGEGVLLDAANEHEQLLELCQGLGVKRVLETHGHWDHIQAVPAMREAGYEVAVTALDAPKLKDVGYDVFIDDAEVIEVGRLRLHAIHNPGHTPGSISFQLEGTPLLFTGDTLFPGGPGNTSFPDADFDTIITSITSKLFTFRQHDDRHRAPTPRGVDRTPLVNRYSRN